MAGGTVKKTGTITCGDDFRSGFAGAVRVVAAERIGLTEGIQPFRVGINLISGNDYDRAERLTVAGCVEKVHCAHDIRGKGGQGVAVTLTYERLCGQVEDHFRIYVTQG